MTETPDQVFHRQRLETYERVTALMEARVTAASPALTLRPDDLSPDSLRQGMEKEAWRLFLDGVRYLKNGAPGDQPGSMTEALSRASLRSSAFAAALGVPRPQFEKILFMAEFSNGHEAALFFCRHLIDAAEKDLPKSRAAIQQKILSEKPDAAIKNQMALSFDILAETYKKCCGDFRKLLGELTPP